MGAPPKISSKATPKGWSKWAMAMASASSHVSVGAQDPVVPGLGCDVAESPNDTSFKVPGLWG